MHPLRAPLALLALVSCVLPNIACDSPTLGLPGGQLEGRVITTPVQDWSFLDDSFLHLETRPDNPYSVELNYVVKEGQLYIDPAEGRRWLEHLREEPRVRARFGNDIYPLQAVLVEDPAELEGFDPDRFVYRLDPRSP